MSMVYNGNHMDPLMAKHILSEVVETTGFDPASQDPDFRLREPGVVRGVVMRGAYEKAPAYLKIILDESGEREVARTKWLATHLNAGPLRVPAVLAYGWCWGKPWMIIQDVGNGKIVGLEYPTTTLEQKAKIAKAFWLTTNTFPQPMEEEREPQDYDASLWFAWKVTEWLRIAEEYGTFKQGIISREEIYRAHRRIQQICQYPFAMRFAHSHFSNEDLRRDEKGVYWLIDFGATRWRPEMYDAAFCMWRVGMHLWQLDSVAFVDEMRKWQNTFDWTSPGPIRNNKFSRPLRACLIERCIGALAVDIGGKRGVVATLSQEEKAQLLGNWRSYLASLL